MLALLKRWICEEEAVVAVEAAFILPLMMTVLCGSIDVGVGVTINMKVNNATQTVSDLLARESTVTESQITDSIVAGRMSIAPYATAELGFDIIGIQYVGTKMVPTEKWRRTENMEKNDDMLTHSEGLGGQNEGVIGVTVRYVYHPIFTGFAAGDWNLSEESYVRGRKGNFVSKV